MFRARVSSAGARRQVGGISSRRREQNPFCLLCVPRQAPLPSLRFELPRESARTEKVQKEAPSGRNCVGDGIRARGRHVADEVCESARCSRRFPAALALAFGYGRHLLLATLRCPPAFDPIYNEVTMRGKTGAMTDRASACCACSVRLLCDTVPHRRTKCDIGALSAREAARRAAFRVRREKMARNSTRPFRYCRPHCTALDGQDFNACVPFVARATALCCCKSWPPTPPPVLHVSILL